MGRKHAEFNFIGKQIAFYEPTDGQAAAMALVNNLKNKNPSAALLRMFKVLEKLLVDPEEWEILDDAMVDGDATLKDYAELISAVFEHEWEEPDKGPEKETAAFNAHEEIARARALLAQHGEA